MTGAPPALLVGASPAPMVPARWFLIPWLLTFLLLAGCEPPCRDGDLCAIIGTGELGFNGDALPALESKLASPTSVTVDPDGRVVVIDFSNMRVRRLDDEGVLHAIVGSGEHAYSAIGVPALDTPLENPEDAAWGPDGLLYVAARHEGRVIRIGADGRTERFAGSGDIGDMGDGGPAIDARMWDVVGITFDGEGALYVSDTSSHRIRRVGTDGTIETVLGTGTRGRGAPGFGPEVAIQSPERLVWDGPRDRLLVADGGNHRVLAVALPSLAVTVIAGSGERGFAGDGGPALEASFDQPAAVAVTPDGVIYIADLTNDALRQVDRDGVIATVAGTPGDVGEPRLVAAPLEMPMRRPAGLRFTDDGDLLIAERGGHRILAWDGVIP